MFSKLFVIVSATLNIIITSFDGFFANNINDVKANLVDDSTTLRDTYKVGVFPREGFFTKETDFHNNTVYRGYAAEIFQTIENNSDLRFEYVIEDHVSIMNDVLNGSLDIYPGTLFTEERAKVYLYSDKIGDLNGVLFTIPTNTNLYQDDYANYKNLRVGMIENFSINSSFATFANEKNFSYIPSYFTEISDGVEAMENGTIDCFFTDSSFRINDFKVLHTFESRSFYNVINKNLTFFQETFNNAIRHILSVTPDFFYLLYSKYYSSTSYGTNISLTREEKEFIDSRKKEPIRAAFKSDSAPVESLKTNGEHVGISFAIYDEISKITGLEFDFTPVSNTAAEYNIPNIEVFASYTYSLNETTRNNIKLTGAIYRDLLVQVSKPNIGENINNIVGISSYVRDDSFDSVRQNYAFREFDSAQDCFLALKNDEVTSIILKENTADYWLKNIVYSGYDKSVISDSLYSEFRFAVTSNASINLYNILEKVIKSFTSSEIYDIYNENTQDTFIYTLMEKLQYDQNFQYHLIIGTFLLAIICVGIVSFMLIRRNYNYNSYVENTKIFNRQHFYKVSEKMIKGSKKKFIFALLQIDRYQVLHATFGDEETRKYMTEMMKYIEKQYYKKSYFVYGLTDNDTFGFCFEYTPDNMDYFAYVSKELSEQPYTNLGGFHIGFYIIKDNSQNPSFYYDYAKLALEKAQANKAKNTIFAYYDESIIQQIQISNYYLSELPRALKEHEFVIYLQPKVDIPSGRINGAEALVRWDHPLEGIISPGRFVPIFEQNGTMVDIDKYVWEATCEFISKNRSKLNEQIPISVNISRSDVYSFGIFTYILNLIKKYQITPNELCFEITESLYAENPQLISSLITRLHSYNFKISMDDFGSAYSSLNMLRNFQVDGLKIDLAFLRETEWNNNDKQNEIGRGECIIKSVVEMAANLKMTCICEGVETKEQLELVKRTKCTNAQGFYYSKPVPTTTFLELLKKGVLKNE